MNMVEKIIRVGRINVLKDLQENHPLTGEEWRTNFLSNITDYIHEKNLPIEREKMVRKDEKYRVVGPPQFTDWFKKKDG